MTDSEALAVVTPWTRGVWLSVLDRLKGGKDRPADPAKAYHAMNSAVAAAYKLGYELGRAEAMADGGM